MSSDKFNLMASSWYSSFTDEGVDNSMIFDDLMEVLSNGINLNGVHNGASMIAADPNLNSGITHFFDNQDGADEDGRPRAYLNWILFDEQFKFVQSSSGFDQVGEADEFKVHVFNNLPITKNGYLYVYVSNASYNDWVYFDNLQVTHIRGPILEETHYYPFGLTMHAISSRAYLSTYNKLLFNDGTELEGKEFNDGSGLEMYSTPFRGYDPQLGRFWQIDLMASDYEDYSPYTFSLNNPIIFNDPTGLESEPVYKELPEVVVTVNRKNKFNYSDWANLVDKYKKFDFYALYNHFEKHGVNERGLRLFQTAWGGIEYRERKAEIDNAAWEMEGIIAKEAIMWAAGGGIVKIGTKLISTGYRGYQIYRASRVSQVTKSSGTYLYHYTSREAAKSISQQGFKVGRDGFSYLTNKGNLSGLQAQIELALPANRALPNAVLKIDVTGMSPSTIRRVTGNIPGYGAGGGKEFLFNTLIPANRITILP